MVVDRDDLLVYASPQLLHFFEIPDFYLQAGTRLRDCLGAIYDHCIRSLLAPNPPSREEWLAERVAAHWRERFEAFDRTSKKRIVRLLNRRLPNGFGICAISDVTEQKKREEQWRSDLERVEVTEDILDNLPQPIMVWDERNIVVGINKAFAAMTGRSEEAILGCPAAEVLEGRFLTSLRQAEQQLGCKRFVRIADPASSDATTAAYINRIGKAERPFTAVTFVHIDGAPHLLRGIMPASTHETSKSPVVGHADHSRHASRIVDTDLVAIPASSVSPIGAADRRMRVAIASSDTVFVANALSVLPRQASDHCIVESPYELQALIELARSASLSIDLIVSDGVFFSGRRDWDSIATLIADRGTVAHRLDRHLRATPGVPATADRSVREPEAAGRANAEILVVEDNEVNQIVFSQILEGLGRSYKLAVNGAEALAIWQADRPAIVLMDISLPDINGMDVCRLMRQRQKQGEPRAAIVGVLVPAFDHDRERCMEAGMDDVIVKPLSPDMIETLLDRHLGLRPTADARRF
ncbi:hypothetical protein BJF91_22670 [Allorhizobium taibaishanense]|nr:hypothetical protein BJF91_22670 [Allorhizobium taibaishanense]